MTVSGDEHQGWVAPSLVGHAKLAVFHTGGTAMPPGTICIHLKLSGRSCFSCGFNLVRVRLVGLIEW